MRDQLSADIRRVIDDAAPSITLDEVRLTDLTSESMRSRHPARWVAAALVAALVLTAVTVLAIRDDGETTSNTAATSPETALGPEHCTANQVGDLAVWMAVNATPGQIATARTTLMDLPGTTIVREVSKKQSYDEFACTFADLPDLVDGVTPADLPASFIVRTSDPAQVRTTMSATAGVVVVNDVPVPRECAPLGNGDLRVYLPVGSTPEQIDATETLVKASTRVTEATTITPERAYAHFQCVTQQTNVRGPDSTPPSLLVVVNGDADAAMAELSSLPGVETVARR